MSNDEIENRLLKLQREIQNLYKEPDILKWRIKVLLLIAEIEAIEKEIK
jgi:hypothetical protein